MKKFEFKVMPVPAKALKFPNLGRGEDAFNQTITSLMNELGSEGWEFTGSEVLPEPKRLFSKHRSKRSVLVFRREIELLEKVELEKAGSTNVFPFQDCGTIRPRRVRKGAPHFSHHAERQLDFYSQLMRA